MRTALLTILITIGSLVTASAQIVDRTDIRLEEQKTINTGKMRIKFVKVMEDSRCPMAAKCVWAGNAKVRIAVSKNGRSWKNFDLNSGVGPRTATYNGYNIIFEDLNPAPNADPKAPKPTPVLTLSVEKH